jgi:hypothetical protein
LGNQALHELEPPDKQDVALAIDIIEDVLNVVYELDYKSALLLERTKNRGKKGQPTNDDSHDVD